MNTTNSDDQQRQSGRSFFGNGSTIGVGVLAANMVLTNGVSAQSHLTVPVVHRPFSMGQNLFVEASCCRYI